MVRAVAEGKLRFAASIVPPAVRITPRSMTLCRPLRPQ
jgi:hypothetical protein